MFFKKVLNAVSLFLCTISISSAGVVRDIETEDTFKVLNAPFVKAIGEDIKDIQFRLVLNDSFNAYVSGGKNIYYMSGMILGVDNASQYLAVTAHELGHIKARHLDQLGKSLDNARAIGMGSAVLGILGGLATKSADSAFGSIMLGGQVAQRGLLSDIRANEVEADYTALELFETAKISPIGQVEINKKMLSKYGFSSQQDIYNRTHPASEDRLDIAELGLKKSPYKNKKYSAVLEKKFARVQAKLFGYTKEKDKVFSKYPIKDQSESAIYARSMFYLAHNKGALGATEIKKLIKKYPNDPYYLEGYANLLYNAGKIKKAIAVYKKALKIYPDAGVMWIEYARYNIDLGGKKNLKEAEYALFRAKRYENNEPYLYRMMIALYSKTREEGKRLLARAEEFYLMGDANARMMAEQAIAKLKKNSAEYIRAQDIMNSLGG